MQTAILKFSISVILLFGICSDAAPAPSDGQTSPSDNPWDYKIERKIKTSIQYEEKNLAVWEEVVTNGSTTITRRYYVTPPVILIPNSAKCKHVSITNSYDVSYDIRMWEVDIPGAVVKALAREFSLFMTDDQIHPLPFFEIRVIWSNQQTELQGLKLTTSWINNLQQQEQYTLHVAADNEMFCQRLADTIKNTPNEFADSLQLQYTLTASKEDSKTVTVTSEQVAGAQLTATLKNMPGADGPMRYLTSNDYNKFLGQIANQVIATETISGDYVEATDEMSLKNVIARMLDAQKENTAQFDNNSWNSVFWDPSSARPDLISKELNKFFFHNLTDNRFYRTKSDTSSGSGSVSIEGIFGVSGSASSSSSMTKDDITHLLEVNNIESEFDGEKWVPKKLDLTRLNMNDLLRKDLVANTRVRVKQVTIGGVLQVGFKHEYVKPRSTLYTGEQLKENECLESLYRMFNACMQVDGNLVVYRKSGGYVWATYTNTKGHGPYSLFMQDDNNLVLNDATGPIWTSNTAGHTAHKPVRLVLQDDGNLVIYGSDDKPIWSWMTGVIA